MNTYVDFATFCKIINRVVSDSFTLDENGETKFNSEGVDFQFRLEVAKNYTKLNYKEDKEVDLDSLYKLVYTDEVNKIINTNPQVITLRSAINDKIQYQIQASISTDKAIVKFINLLSEKVRSIDTSVLTETNMQELKGLANKVKDIDMTNTEDIVRAIMKYKPKTPKKNITKTK